jgi:hypothetical protein
VGITGALYLWGIPAWHRSWPRAFPWPGRNASADRRWTTSRRESSSARTLGDRRPSMPSWPGWRPRAVSLYVSADRREPSGVNALAAPGGYLVVFRGCSNGRGVRRSWQGCSPTRLQTSRSGTLTQDRYPAHVDRAPARGAVPET